jgi:hypothetical protein
MAPTLPAGLLPPAPARPLGSAWTSQDEPDRIQHMTGTDNFNQTAAAPREIPVILLDPVA